MGTCRASSGDDVFRLFSPFPSSIPLLTVFCYCTHSAYAILRLQTFQVACVGPTELFLTTAGGNYK